jgi:hypothetical protein
MPAPPRRSPGWRSGSCAVRSTSIAAAAAAVGRPSALQTGRQPVPEQVWPPVPVREARPLQPGEDPIARHVAQNRRDAVVGRRAWAGGGDGLRTGVADEVQVAKATTIATTRAGAGDTARRDSGLTTLNFANDMTGLRESSSVISIDKLQRIRGRFCHPGLPPRPVYHLSGVRW